MGRGSPLRDAAVRTARGSAGFMVESLGFLCSAVWGLSLGSMRGKRVPFMLLLVGFGLRG